VYFGKPVAWLTLPEALTLAVIPQNPAKRLSPIARGSSFVIDPALARSRDRLFKRWIALHPEDASLKPLFALPMTMRPIGALPFEAPHGVDQLLADARVTNDVGGTTVTATIDRDLQHVLERQLGRYVARSSDGGIRNASAILVDTRDMGIKAMVGSANYFDRTLPGQVNGTLARRSPGSTLKPFI